MLEVCERHARRVRARGARARGFYFPTDGFVQLRAAAPKTINKYYLLNSLWKKVGPAQTYVVSHTAKMPRRMSRGLAEAKNR